MALSSLAPYRTAELSGPSGTIRISDMVDDGLQYLVNEQLPDGTWGGRHG